MPHQPMHKICYMVLSSVLLCGWYSVYALDSHESKIYYSCTWNSLVQMQSSAWVHCEVKEAPEAMEV